MTGAEKLEAFIESFCELGRREAERAYADIGQVKMLFNATPTFHQIVSNEILAMFGDSGKWDSSSWKPCVVTRWLLNNLTSTNGTFQPNAAQNHV